MGEPILLTMMGYIKSLDTIFRVGKWVYGKLVDVTPIKNAITLTAKEYPDAEIAIESALKKLLTSDEFTAELEKAESGKEIVPDETLVNLLIDKGGFYTGISSTTRDALIVLQTFSRYLRDELLRSSDANVHLGRQQDEHHKETLNAISVMRESVISGFAGLHNKGIAGQFSGQEIEDEAQLPIHEKLYEDRIQTAHVLLQEGKTDSVKSILTKLRKEVSERSVSTELQVSIAGMLGRCALRANDPETALGAFTEALRLKNDCVMTQSYLAITALFLNKNDLANHYVDLIANSEKRDSIITANYIRVLFGLGRYDDFEKFIIENKWVQGDAQCALIIGMARYEQSRFDEAENYFQITALNLLLFPLAKLLESQSIGRSVYKQYEDDPPLDWRIPPEARARLEKAEAQLLEVREFFGSHDNKTNYLETLVHLSHIQRMLLKFEDAEDSCSLILIVDPHHAEALRHKALLLLGKGNAEGALRLMQGIPKEAFDECLLQLPMAKAYIRLKKFAEAENLLTPLLNLNQTEKSQIEIAGLLLICWSNLKLNEKVNTLKEQLLSFRNDDPMALIVVSHQIDREGNYEEALELLDRALEKCQSNRERDIVTLEIAEFCFARELWEKASSSYERVIDTSKDVPLVRKYLFSLFHAGKAAQALELSQKLRGDGDPLLFISEIEARILEWIGDLQPALLIYEALSNQEPEQWGYKYSQIKILLRQGKHEKAGDVLISINYDDIRDQPNALIIIAALRQELSLGDELKYAWRARRKGFNQSEIHSKYIDLFLHRSEDSEGSLNVLTGTQVDCAVKLLNPKTQERKDYIIEPEEPDPTRDEISPSDPKVTALLGAKEGETIIFNEGEIAETTWIVEDVQSKYVYGFQQSMSKSQSWFNDSAITSIYIGDPEKSETLDLSNIFKMLDHSHDRGREILELHNKHIFPLGAIAELKKKNIYDVWSSFLGSFQKLYVTPGDVRSREQEQQILKSSSEIVLDVTGLLTLQYLKLLDQLPKMFSQIFVPRHLVDEIEEWGNDLLKNKDKGWIAKGEENYVFYETSLVEKQEQEIFLSKIKAFVNESCEIVPTKAALDYSQEKMDEITKLTGVSPFASILVSIEKDRPLYSDDYGLQRIGIQLQPALQVCGIQSILLKMKDRGLISKFRYNEALYQLILGSYFYVSVDAFTLWWICTKNQKKPTTEIGIILKRQLNGPDAEYLSALFVAGSFIHKVWLEVTVKEDKMQIIDLAIEAIMTGRDFIQTKIHLKTVLSVIFKHYKSPLIILFERIDNWDFEIAKIAIS